MTVKILVVDDVPANRIALNRLLTRPGLDVVEAESGFEALQRVLEHDFALVLLDIQMPEMDGFEVLEMLKRLEITRHLPVLLMTAVYKDDQHRLKGYASGSVDYIEKPIQENILLAKVDVFVDLYQRKAQLQELIGQLHQANQALQIQVTQRIAAERAARDSEQRYRSVLANVPGTVYRCLGMEPYEFLFVSPAIEELCGYSHPLLMAEYPGLGLLIDPADRPQTFAAVRQAHGSGDWHSRAFAVDCRIRCRDGTRRWVTNRGQWLDDEHGSYIDGVMIDITDKKRAEEELRIAAAVFEMYDGVLVMDPAARILRVNQAFTQITGYPAKLAIGRTPRMLLQSRQLDRTFYRRLWQALQTTGYWQGEITHRRQNGEEYPAWQTITAVSNERGQVTHYVAVFSDITERKKHEQLIKQFAYRDFLTGLHNRRSLLDRLEHEIAIARRRHLRGALMFIDLDNFKTLNDSLGHDAGDELLRQAAGRLTGAMREEDTVARLGGDEFVILMRGAAELPDRFARQALEKAERIREALNAPFQLGAHACVVTPSIGVTIFPDYGDDLEQLLKQADVAMYQVKAAGRNGVGFFQPGP